MTRFRLILATVGLLVVPSNTTRAQQPAPLRTLATFSGDSVQDFGVSPNGKFVLVQTPNALRVYEAASRKSWDAVRGNTIFPTWAPQGDRIAWTQVTSASDVFLWSMPIDARTGKPRGAAQRVTTVSSAGAAFSADGKWIAYLRADSPLAMGVYVVPASGGPARLVSNKFALRGAWSADGKSLYVEEVSGPVKIRVSDGTRQVLSTPPRESFVGLTGDRRYLITSSVELGTVIRSGDHATITDTTGRTVGSVPLPAGKVLSLPVSLGDSVLVIGVTTQADGALEVRPAAGGPPKRLPLVGQSNTLPLWSPDGRRIAFFAPSAGRTALGVMNADGTDPHVYQDVDVLADSWGALWSPDSRSIAFRRADTLGMHLLDVASGSLRRIASDPIGQWKWRGDGQGLLIRARRAPGAGIDELLLNGQRRTLLDWPMPGKNLAWNFLGDSSIFRISELDSVVYLQPLGPAPARPLTTLPFGSSAGRPTASKDSREIVIFHARRTGNAWATNQIEHVSLAKRTGRVIDLPFSWLTGGTVSNPGTFLPGDSAVLIFGKRPKDSDVKLFRVPLSGATPTVFADVGATGDGVLSASVSPDGRSVVYSVRPKAATHSLVILDLRSVIPKSSRPAKP